MNAYPSLQTSLSKSHKADEKVLPANCDFMKYLQPSGEAIEHSQQNAEEYEDVYKTLSSGVYESSDAFEPEQENEVYQQIMEEKQKEQEEVQSDRDEDLYQSLNGKPQSLDLAVKNEHQDVKLQQKVAQSQKQYEKVQTVTQNAVLSHLQQKFIQQQSSHSEQMQNDEPTYPSLEHNQPISSQPFFREAQQQQQEKMETEVHEVPQMTENDTIVQKQLESSIHICVEESITLPEQQENIIQTPPKKEPERLETIEKPRPQISQASKLQFKPIEVNLQKFSNHQQQHGGTKVSITGYQQQFFLKIQTQVFKIDISRKEMQYAIKRRFSQFLTLQKLIRHYYPGYILYPFPEKSLEFFKKLKLSFGSQQEKIILIEKRLFELERYLKFLVSHREIATSIILEIFLEESTDVFQRQTNNLLSIMQDQQKELQLGVIEENYNSIKKLMKSGFSFINSYIALSSNDTDLEANLKELQAKSKRNNELFDTIEVQLEECSEKLSNFATNIERLAQIYKANSEVSNIESSIDSVLKLSSKMSSSRSFSQKYCEWIEDNLLYHIRYYEVLLRTIRHSIDFRGQLLQKIDSLNSQSYSMGEKIQQKIQLFEQRFVRDWSDIVRQFDHNLAILYQKFNTEWKIHCQLMSKIWR